jgi:S-adenosyl-L-methionine hydrolase (adenosine-forming)
MRARCEGGLNGIITLTTDFGDTGGYAAAMKGVILGIAPDVQIVDISHQITPQNIFEAAFLLSTVYLCFPRHTVHLVVVDPGVGTDRRIAAIKTLDGTFVGPDNGVLSYVMRNYAKDIGQTPDGLSQVELLGEARAVSVTNTRHFRHPVSPTFHGRDIMAPVAAMLSKGLDLTAFGEPLQRLNMLDLPQPVKLPDGTLVGHVVIIDSFGNVITDVRAEDLPQGGELRIELGKIIITGLKRTYAEGSGPMALIDSSGYLEIAVPGGDAAAVTGLQSFDQIQIRAGA